jgi:hypothetical protein
MTEPGRPEASMDLPKAEYNLWVAFLYDRRPVGLSVPQRGKPIGKGKLSCGNSLEKGVRHDHQENL